MLAPTSFSYLEVAILSEEAMFALGIDAPQYSSAVESGLLEATLDLCPARPGALMVHNFWDLLRYRFLATPLDCRDQALPISSSIIDGILDDIANILDQEDRCSDADPERWSLHDEIYQTITAYANALQPASVSRLVTAWRLTEFRIAISLFPETSLLSPVPKSRLVDRMTTA